MTVLFISWLLSLIISPPNACNNERIAGTYPVEVINGYGSGIYSAGDTVHIFSESREELFRSWYGDSELLSSNNWHTWFIMPPRKVKFFGQYASAAAPELRLEYIKGRDLPKPVYYQFPKGHKGLVFLFHGSGGSAAQFEGSFESLYFIRELLNAGYAVAITECEEATLKKDTNGDGHRRWNYLPADIQRNVDYANIHIIKDAFLKEGLIDKSTPLFAAGMSNGGAFAGLIAPALNFNAAISFCAQAPPLMALKNKTPVMYAMQSEDSHDAVGKAGNLQAYKNHSLLKTAGICSRYIENPRSPLYPQRFARLPSISVPLSETIFREIRGNGFLDDKNYLKISGREIAGKFRANPSAFPAIRKLTIAQMAFIAEQLDCSFADHRMFSDLSKSAIQFLDDQCN